MNIQEDVTRQVSSMLMQSTGAVVDTANEMMQLLLDVLRQKAEENKSERALLYNTTGEVAIDKLQNAVRNGAVLKNIFVPDEDIGALQKHFKNLNVLFAISDVEKDNAKLVSFLERDEGKVMKSIELLKAERGLISELPPQLFLDSHQEENFLVTTNMDKVQLELFRNYAKESGIVFAAVTDAERVNLLYAPEYKDRVNAALLRLGWDLNGPNGKAIREQVQHSLEAKKALSYAIDHGPEDLFVVSSNNVRNYVNIYPDGYTLYKNDNEIVSMEKSADGYKDSVLDKVESLTNAVILTREEFERSLAERQEIVDSKYTLDVLPKDYSIEEESARVKQLQNILALKMGLNNELDDTFALFDPSVSYSEFDSHEFVSDSEVREAEKREMERYNDSVRYAQNEFRTFEISSQNRSLDYLISRAEQEREAMVQGKQEKTQTKEKTTEEVL